MLLIVATAAEAQTVQTINREQSRILLDVQGYERASESYRYVQAADYSSETYAVGRWLPRDEAFGVASMRELAPNFTFRPTGRAIDTAWVHSYLPKFKERQLVFEEPLSLTEKFKLVRFNAEPAVCVAFELVVGDIGVRSDSSTGTRHASVGGVACSQKVKRLTDEDIGRVLAGVRIGTPGGGMPQPVFDTPEARPFLKR